jgi:DMSO/TMAO reductase YedYZ molybdopterin-dependent catalytic subunit
MSDDAEKPQEAPVVPDVEEAERPGPPQAEAGPEERDVDLELRRRSRRAFLTAGLAAVGAVSGWTWLKSRRDVDGLPWPLRLGHQVNEQVWTDFYDTSRLAPTFPRSRAEVPRVNGLIGLAGDFDPAAWTLRVEGLAPREVGEGSDPTSVVLTLDDIKALPRVEMVTEFKCIEGWSQVWYWAGARFSDFAARYGPATRSGRPPDVANDPGDLVRYVGMATPDGGYYVGLDMPSALHPQTLLCYEMNGEPLAPQHGAPLRLAVPVKYGIKNLKRIGVVRFTDRRPADFWAEYGYDWYSGL